MAEKQIRLEADRPLSDPDHDTLGYAGFAKNIADALVKGSPDECLVVAINGPWGTGKTTLLNFVRHYLEAPDDGREKPIVLTFNPWWFAGREDLARQFFAQMQAGLGKKERVPKEVKEALKKLGEAVSVSGIPVVAIGGKIWVQFALPPEKDIPGLKEETAKALRKAPHKIVVIMDDIDRLIAEEITCVFRTIKGVADLPNVVYLLAFDKNIVVKALDETLKMPGEEYLEKIVQLSLDLPRPNPRALRDMLQAKLDGIFVDTPQALREQTEWDKIIGDLIAPFIKTPRHVVRLTNALAVTYPPVRGEVNAVDFLGVETLHIFDTAAYDTVRRNLHHLVGVSFGLSSTSDDGSVRSILAQLPGGAEPNGNQGARALVEYLFPRIRQVLDNEYFDDNDSRRWAAERRVCDRNTADAYFRLAVPAHRLSDKEMMSILALVEDRPGFIARLEALRTEPQTNGHSKLEAFLDQLSEYASARLDHEKVAPLVETLLSEDVQARCVDRTTLRLFTNGMEDLLRRLDEPLRFDVIDRSMNQNAIGTACDLVANLGIEHGHYDEYKNQIKPASERLLTAEHLSQLEAKLLTQMRHAAQDKRLLAVPNLREVLYVWKERGADNEARQWFESIVGDDNMLAEAVQALLQWQPLPLPLVKTQGAGHKGDPLGIEEFIDASVLRNRLQQLQSSQWLSETQKSAVETCLRAYQPAADE